jgi:hypothetical protein
VRQTGPTGTRGAIYFIRGAMVADQEKDFAAEALWLIVPTSGPRRGANGSPKLVRCSSGPSVMDTFAQDEWKLGGRAPLLKKHFDAIRTPTLVIDQPRGFIGHFSGWGWTAASARPSMDEGIRCQKAATSILAGKG